MYWPLFAYVVWNGSVSSGLLALGLAPRDVLRIALTTTSLPLLHQRTDTRYMGPVALVYMARWRVSPEFFCKKMNLQTPPRPDDLG